VVDGGEERGGVSNVVAEEEHIRLPVHQGSVGVGLLTTRGVPDDEPDYPGANQVTVLIAEQGGWNIILVECVIAESCYQ